MKINSFNVYLSEVSPYLSNTRYIFLEHANHVTSLSSSVQNLSKFLFGLCS